MVAPLRLTTLEISGTINGCNEMLIFMAVMHKDGFWWGRKVLFIIRPRGRYLDSLEAIRLQI